MVEYISSQRTERTETLASQSCSVTVTIHRGGVGKGILTGDLTDIILLACTHLADMIEVQLHSESDELHVPSYNQVNCAG